MISNDQISAWAVSGESEMQEFKRTSGQRREAARTLCAMLNHRGGRVLFGVEPDGRVVGQQVSEHTLEEIAQELREIEPPVFPAIDRVAVSRGREVLVVSVGSGHGQPYTHRGQAYRRVGATNQALSREEYNRVLLERLHADSRWETQPATGWSVSDLDEEEIRRTLEEGVRIGRIGEPGNREPEAILRGLGLIKEGALLRAAVVLFGRADRLLPDYAQCLLRVARFRGTEKGEFLDNRRFFGNAFDLLKQAERFLLEHMPIAGRFEPGNMVRIDEPAYSPLAFREAMANAICHREYTSGGSSIGVAIYDDRLEVTSSGTLHFGITPQSLFEPHESRPWNPLIASVFYRRGIIETWGQGTLKMAAWTEEIGVPKPEILEIPGAVLVRFQRRIAAETTGKEHGAGTKSGLSRDQVGTKSVLNAQQVEVLELAQSPKSLPELMTSAGRTNRTKFRDQVVRPLLDAGLLEMTIPGKPRSSKQRYRTTAAGLERIGRRPS
jgi:ATP-dependent DNA helicase RecG